MRAIKDNKKPLQVKTKCEQKRIEEKTKFDKNDYVINGLHFFTASCSRNMIATFKFVIATRDVMGHEMV